MPYFHAGRVIQRHLFGKPSGLGVAGCFIAALLLVTFTVLSIFVILSILSFGGSLGFLFGGALGWTNTQGIGIWNRPS